MGLTNSQHDELIRMYDKRQLERARELNRRKEYVYSHSPRYAAIEGSISDLAVNEVRNRLSGKPSTSLSAQMEAFSQEKAAILASLSLPADYLSPPYTCPICKDTGYVHNTKCTCFKQAENDLLYGDANLNDSRETLESFSLSYYSRDIIPGVGTSPYEAAERALSTAIRMVETFDEKHPSLLLTGMAGLGKTHLSRCIAGALMNDGHSVLYLTAFRLFEIFEQKTFDRDSDVRKEHSSIFDSELLIIDDLGTEMPNAFTKSRLFHCINERLISGKSTIISTNLDLKQLMNTYDERIFSRLVSNYSMLHLYGDDIRLKRQIS